jgi:hypothetical protein
MSLVSWGETLTVSLVAGQITVRSVCSWPLQIIDWGKNRQNVERFLVPFSARDQGENVLPTGPTYVDDAGNTPLSRVLADDDDT